MARSPGRPLPNRWCCSTNWRTATPACAIQRWQDVEELLDAGVDVWSTMNVQHLESLNDIVSGITGIASGRRSPTGCSTEADEVVVVDLPPDELLLRSKQGKGLSCHHRPSGPASTSSARAT